MPTGIILSSGSQGATKEETEEVLRKHGYEVDAPEPAENKEKEETPAKAATEEEKKENGEPENKKEKDNEPEHLSRRQKAVQKATEQLRKDLQEANRRIAELEKGGKSGKEEREVEPEEEKAPKREDFPDEDSFNEALFDWRYEQRRKKEQEIAAQKEQEDTLKANWEGYRSKVAEFKEDHEDWDEVVNQPIPIQESCYLAIHELENGPAVTYYLGQHPDEAKAIYKKSPLAAIMEIGNLSERLKPKPAKRDAGEERAPAPRKTPEPVTPVSTAATTSTSTSKDAALKRDFRAFKAAQRKRQ